MPNARLRTARKWGLRAVVAIAAIAVLWELFLVFVHIATTYLWFDSVQHGPVYTTMIKAQVLLFCVFAVIGGLVGGLTVLALLRMRKPLPFDPKDDPFRWTFRHRVERRVRWLIVVLAVAVPAIRVGSARRLALAGLPAVGATPSRGTSAIRSSTRTSRSSSRSTPSTPSWSRCSRRP